MVSMGAAGLFAGIALILASLSFATEALFVLGVCIAGVGFGAGFQGAIRIVVPLALPHQRAGLLSVAFVIAYLSMGLPAVGAGGHAAAAHAGGKARQFAPESGIMARMASRP